MTHPPESPPDEGAAAPVPIEDYHWPPGAFQPPATMRAIWRGDRSSRRVDVPIFNGRVRAFGEQRDWGLVYVDWDRLREELAAMALVFDWSSDRAFGIVTGSDVFVIDADAVDALGASADHVRLVVIGDVRVRALLDRRLPLTASEYPCRLFSRAVAG